MTRREVCPMCGSSRIAHDRTGPSFCLGCNCTMEVQA